MWAVQPSVQVTYLYTPPFGQGKAEQCGMLEKFVVAKDDLMLTTEEDTVLDHFPSLLSAGWTTDIHSDGNRVNTVSQGPEIQVVQFIFLTCSTTLPSKEGCKVILQALL